MKVGFIEKVAFSAKTKGGKEIGIQISVSGNSQHLHQCTRLKTFLGCSMYIKEATVVTAE